MSPALWLALASLVIVPAAADAFELPHQLVLALGASVLAWRAAQFSVSRRHAMVVVVWLAAAVLSTAFSASRGFSVPALFTLASAAFLSLFVSHTQRWTPLLWTAWPIAAYALAQALGRDLFDWQNVATWCGGTRPFSTLGHPTQLAVWMALVAVLALEEGMRGAPRSFAWLTAAVCALTCVSTLSRAGWLALGVGVTAWALLRFGRDARRLRWLGGGALAVAALAAVVAGPSALVERVTHALIAPTRLQLWGTALAGFRERPVFGWGLDAFLLVDQQLRHPEAWKYEWGGTAGHAHSLPANVLATQGLVGGLVVVLLTLFVVRTWRRAPSPLLAPVLGLAAASLVSFSGVLVLALGWCVLAASLRDVERRMPSWLWWLTLVPLLGTAMLFGASLAGGAAERAATATPCAPGQPCDATAATRCAPGQPCDAATATACAPGRPCDATTATRCAPGQPCDAATATACAPGQPCEPHTAAAAAPAPAPSPSERGDPSAGDQRLSRADALFLAAARLDVWTGEWLVRHGVWLERQQDFARARQRYELATARVPGVAVFEANVGRVAGLQRDREAAHLWFERARRHSPLDARIALDAAEAALRLDELPLADDTLRFTLSLYPADGPAWLMLARVRLAQQRPVEARAALEASLDADWRDWPDGLGVARTLLAALQEGLGDPALAAKTRERPGRFALPADICGAPSKLGRADAP